MLKNNHYIRLNEKQEIIKVFSDAFEQPIIGDIRIKENGVRCYQEDWPELNNLTHFPSGCYWFTYVDGHIIKRNQEELNVLPEMLEFKKQQNNNLIKQELQTIDIQSIRAIREFLVTMQDCPQDLKDHEEDAKIKRSKLK